MGYNVASDRYLGLHWTYFINRDNVTPPHVDIQKMKLAKRVMNYYVFKLWFFFYLKTVGKMNRLTVNYLFIDYIIYVNIHHWNAPVKSYSKYSNIIMPKKLKTQKNRRAKGNTLQSKLKYSNHLLWPIYIVIPSFF